MATLPRVVVVTLAATAAAAASCRSPVVEAFAPPAPSLLSPSLRLRPPRIKSAAPAAGVSPVVLREQPPKDVLVSSPDAVPAVPPDATVDVWYAEQAIQALGTIGEVVEAYHTGLVFNVRPASPGGETEMECPEEFTIEWYAVNFPFGAFLPGVVEADGDADEFSSRVGLSWENEAHPYYSPVYNPDRWSKGRTLVGSIDGEGFAKFVDFVVEYNVRKPGYQAFEVWDRPNLVPGKTRRWGPGSDTCSTFIEEGLSELYRLGGAGNPRMIENKELLMRSYLQLVAKSEPTKVDPSDPEQVRAVREFYIQLNKAARGVDGEGLTTSGFVRLLADRLETFYVYDPPKDEYYRVELGTPYFALADLYQPMSLPWQRLDMGYAVVDPGGFAEPGKDGDDEDEGRSFTEELGSAAGSVGDLAKRRLPEVLKRRFGPKLAVPVGVGLALTFVAVVTNEPFVAGVAVGVAVGAVGAKVLL